jgi:hypothetical protein
MDVAGEPHDLAAEGLRRGALPADRLALARGERGEEGVEVAE